MKTDYQRYVTESTWQEFDHGPRQFDSEGYAKFCAERRAYFAPGRDRLEAPSILRSWAREMWRIISHR